LRELKSEGKDNCLLSGRLWSEMPDGEKSWVSGKEGGKRLQKKEGEGRAFFRKF